MANARKPTAGSDGRSPDGYRRPHTYRELPVEPDSISVDHRLQ